MHGCGVSLYPTDCFRRMVHNSTKAHISRECVLERDMLFYFSVLFDITSLPAYIEGNGKKCPEFVELKMKINRRLQVFSLFNFRLLFRSAMTDLPNFSNNYILFVCLFFFLSIFWRCSSSQCCGIVVNVWCLVVIYQNSLKC